VHETLGNTLEPIGISSKFLNTTSIAQHLRNFGNVKMNPNTTIIKINSKIRMRSIQNGDWDTDADCVSFVNQGPC
jgi:hypothetical protein